MCPNCKKELNCPCEHCNNPEPKWIWIDGELIKCPLCGYTAHADEWEEFEIQECIKSEGK